MRMRLGACVPDEPLDFGRLLRRSRVAEQRYAVAHRSERFGIAVAGVAAMTACAACGTSPEERVGAPLTPAATKASTAQSQPGKAQHPQLVDRVSTSVDLSRRRATSPA
jgi:hypothetical protein